MQTHSLHAERTASHFDATPWLAAVILGIVFLIADHSFQRSTWEEFTGPVDELQQTTAGGNVLRQIAFLSLGALGAFLLARPNRFEARPSRIGMFLIGGLLSWCALSIFWSTDFSITGRRLVVLACCVAGAAGLIKEYSLRQLLKIALIVSGSHFVIGLISELVLNTFRPFGAEYRFGGSLHPNAQGVNLVVMCLATICFAQDRSKHRRWLVALFCVGLVFLVLTKSRTALAGLMIGIALIWLQSTQLRTKILSVASITWLAGAVTLILMCVGADCAGELIDMALLGRSEDASTLTARLPLWDEVMIYAHKRPVLGYGYESFWNADRMEAVADELGWNPIQSHSGYLDAVLTVGVVGMIVLVAVVLVGIAYAWRLYQVTQDSAYGFVLGILMFGLFSCFTESGMITPDLPSFLGATVLLHSLWYGRMTQRIPTFAPAAYSLPSAQCQVS